MTKGWITPQEAVRLNPDFFTERGKQEWLYDTRRDGYYSEFGFAEYRIQTGRDGMPAFGRVVYGEKPNINGVVWGKDADGIVKVAVIVQARPLADMPSGMAAEMGIIFGQPCVMGFRDNFGGMKNLEKVFEAAQDAAVREALEEAGVQDIIDVQNMGHHNPNPTFCATWSELFDIEVDLTKITGVTDRTEQIYRAEYISVKEVLQRIASGEYEGVNYRSATANDALMVWLTRHPEALG